MCGILFCEYADKEIDEIKIAENGEKKAVTFCCPWYGFYKNNL